MGTRLVLMSEPLYHPSQQREEPSILEHHVLQNLRENIELQQQKLLDFQIEKDTIKKVQKT